jgi:hypothetical protein
MFDDGSMFAYVETGILDECWIIWHCIVLNCSSTVKILAEFCASNDASSYEQMVHEFSIRQLSHTENVLNATAGILDLMASELDIDFIYEASGEVLCLTMAYTMKQ